MINNDNNNNNNNINNNNNNNNDNLGGPAHNPSLLHIVPCSTA